MPAQSPVIEDTSTAKLSALGQCIRTQRKALRVSAKMAAESAGMSRVTLHRIEHGEPSVTMGAYLNAMSALGLEIDVVTRSQPRGGSEPVPGLDGAGKRPPDPGLAPTLCVADYPQLQQLAWQLPGASELTPAEALGVYERNWRHLELAQMNATERALLNTLVSTLGKGHLLV